MKKVALSALAAAMMSGAVYADTLTLYTDAKTGQVYTTPGEGRTEMGDFIDAKSVDMANREQSSSLSEYQDSMKKYVNVKSKAKTIEFSGTHYFGLTSVAPKYTNANTADSTGFELRRNYLQAKAYFNDKDYFRVTMDTTKEIASTTSNAFMYVKYAYLYLDKVLPYTGVEIGIAHRPWIDYEEHNAWFFRSINKVNVEQKTTATESGSDLINSADLGFNLQTKTPYISTELGMFNGEGYHADKAAANQENSKDLSFEWRLTGHLLGNGEHVGKYKLDKDTYANISTFGIISKNHKDDNVTVGDHKEYDRSFYGIHAVYNQPEFLIAAQYYADKDDVKYASANDTLRKGWSINGEIRPMEHWTILGRYDKYKQETETPAGVKTTTSDMTQTIYGVAYEYNKNVKFIANGKHISDSKEVAAASEISKAVNKNVYMLTTEVEW
ncbi:hypothetical protein [Sulfuricurvum sp.]|uniref:hypothetical protein n=1 Tax=Sulfuricurvum sp. TaxID=2025608 RepID=UPI002D79E520|nr:hypothetical protein [Sulfuricurvum sp.]